MHASYGQLRPTCEMFTITLLPAERAMPLQSYLYIYPFLIIVDAYVHNIPVTWTH